MARRKAKIKTAKAVRGVNVNMKWLVKKGIITDVERRGSMRRIGRRMKFASAWRRF